MAAHARDVNILIWTSRKSVGHETNDRAMVHGDGTRADGRRSRCFVHISEIRWSRDQRGAGVFGNRKSNVVHVQPGRMDRPTTEAPETQFYFITHRSGAFLPERICELARGSAGLGFARFSRAANYYATPSTTRRIYSIRTLIPARSR